VRARTAGGGRSVRCAAMRARESAGARRGRDAGTMARGLQRGRVWFRTSASTKRKEAEHSRASGSGKLGKLGRRGT
jgi:hypothetical protein